MKKDLIIKESLILIAITILGFILLNLTFIFDAIFQSILRRLLAYNLNILTLGIPINMHLLFAIIILLISWFVFKSNLKNLYKAIYSSVPTAVILVTEGILLYRWPVAAFIAGALFYGIIILYLYKTKKSWYFYYSVSWVTLALLVMSILGIDI